MSIKAIYWSSTIALALFLVWSALTYLFKTEAIEGVRALGFPDYFRLQLAVLKLLAVVILLIPATPLLIKDWAYAGIGLFFITAIVAHWAHKDPLVINLINLAMLVILALSRIYLHRLAELVSSQA